MAKEIIWKESLNIFDWWNSKEKEHILNIRFRYVNDTK